MVKNVSKKKFSLPSEARYVLFQSAIFLCAFVLTPLKFIMGIFPFGLAFCLATKKHALFSICGSLLSVIFFMDSNPVYIISLGFILVFRGIASLLARPKKSVAIIGQRDGLGFFSDMFEESVALRVSISVALALGINLYYVIVNGYRYFDIFALVFSLALYPILTYAFCGLYEKKTKNKHFSISILLLFFCFVYLINGREVLGIDFSIVLTYMIVLYVSKNASSPLSSLVGTVLGLGGNTTFAPIYALAGIVSGLGWHISPYLAIMSSFVLSLGYGIFVSGYEAIVYLAPEILGASLIMYPLLRFEVLPKPSFLVDLGEKKKSLGKHIIKKEGERFYSEAIKMSSSLSDVSKMLGEVSLSARTPTLDDYSHSVFEICRDYCYLCPKNEICWEKDLATTRLNITKMSDSLYNVGEVQFEALETKFLHRCPNVEKIIDTVNGWSSSQRKSSVKEDKLGACATSIDTLSKMISAFLEKQTGGEEVNSRLTELAIKEAYLCGLQFEKLEVLGLNKKKIVIAGVDINRSSCTLDELKNALSSSLGLPLDSPILNTEGDFAAIEISSLPLYKTSSHVASLPTEKQNGDSVSTFKSEDGREYFIICDGMGTGKNASLTSTMCVSFLEKILSVSSERELALAMLNNLVLYKSEECSSSVDLLEIDLTSTESCFLKSGACPSFIKRGDKVFTLQSKTAPIGIMKRLDSEKTSFQFESGDICVMVSDGVIGASGEYSWLVDYLSTFHGTPSEIAGEILKESKNHIESTDDSSVIVIKFE